MHYFGNANQTAQIFFFAFDQYMIGANSNKHHSVFGAFEKSLPLVILDVFALRTRFYAQLFNCSNLFDFEQLKNENLIEQFTNRKFRCIEKLQEQNIEKVYQVLWDHEFHYRETAIIGKNKKDENFLWNWSKQKNIRMKRFKWKLSADNIWWSRRCCKNLCAWHRR